MVNKFYDPPKNDSDRVKILRDSAEEALCWLEEYCSCRYKGTAAKKLRVALEVTCGSS